MIKIIKILQVVMEITLRERLLEMIYYLILRICIRTSDYTYIIKLMQFLINLIIETELLCVYHLKCCWCCKRKFYVKILL